ncbi:MAG TPA: hypothetical protein VNP92_11970 [Actinophytocola sp.]|nr:hypothetical protein [Actinophytocola sp.]
MAQHRLLFRFLADLARVAAAVGALAALVGIPSFGMEARFLLVLFVLMLPRATGGVPAPLDFVFGATLLVALWTSTAAWYGATPIGWLVHALATGVTAVVLYLVLVQVQVLGEPSGSLRRVRVVGWTVLLGVVVGGVWEAFRWFESVAHVGASLAGHLLVDAVGAMVAGLVLAALRGPRRGHVVREDRGRGRPEPGRIHRRPTLRPVVRP